MGRTRRPRVHSLSGVERPQCARISGVSERSRGDAGLFGAPKLDYHDLSKHQMAVTPAAIYTCWHHGLEGGVRLIRKSGMPEDSNRCATVYVSLAAAPNS